MKYNTSLQNIALSTAESWFGKSLSSIANELKNREVPSVHIHAVLQCLYARKDRRNTLPISLRSYVEHKPSSCIAKQHKSQDGTVKWVIRLDDKRLIETVLIPEKDRNTLCISSQVGCAFGCTFCATGKMGFKRNLSCTEILEQVVIANDYLAQTNKQVVTNIVFMGMGEPLHNFDAVINSAEILCNDSCFGLSHHRVTISTVGLVPAIKKMIGKTSVSLALSLHAPNDEARRKIMPISRKYTIEQTLAAVKSYLESLSGRRSVLIEYTLIAGNNDSNENAYQLASLLSNIRCKINLIPCNSVNDANTIASSDSRTLDFLHILCSEGQKAVIRRTRGEDINAACGQLALQNYG